MVVNKPACLARYGLSRVNGRTISIFGSMRRAPAGAFGKLTPSTERLFARPLCKAQTTKLAPGNGATKSSTAKNAAAIGSRVQSRKRVGIPRCCAKARVAGRSVNLKSSSAMSGSLPPPANQSSFCVGSGPGSERGTGIPSSSQRAVNSQRGRYSAVVCRVSSRASAASFAPNSAAAETKFPQTQRSDWTGWNASNRRAASVLQAAMSRLPARHADGNSC